MGSIYVFNPIFRSTYAKPRERAAERRKIILILAGEADLKGEPCKFLSINTTPQRMQIIQLKFPVKGAHLAEKRLVKTRIKDKSQGLKH